MADSDVIVVGAGLAGLAATAELAEAGRKVLLLDQEPESSLGGQAHWSLGGLFLIGSPEQRRMGIRDSRKLAWQDWQGSAGFDRGSTTRPARTTGLAAGEVAGFGGGGMHGYRSLEGTFLGGCLFSGRQAGRTAARKTAS